MKDENHRGRKVESLRKEAKNNTSEREIGFSLREVKVNYKRLIIVTWFPPWT